MKILFMCNSLHGGGAERVCVDLANGLSTLGHQVMILTDLSTRISYLPDPCVELIDAVRYKGAIRFRIDSFLRIREVLREKRPDVIISILYFNATIAKLVSWMFVQCPIILSDHNSFERPVERALSLRDRINKFYLNYLYDYLTVLTEADRRYLNGRFKKVEVMPNPLAFRPVNKVLKKEKIILAVGRLDDWFYKGFDLLIKVWLAIQQDYPEWQLRIVGSGNEQSACYLRDLAQETKSITFIPYTCEIVEEYRKASIFVLSSRYEGFGLVLTEAMSQGCACVACDYKGRQAEIVSDGVTGLLCPVEDEDELADRIRKLIDNPDLRMRLQENAIHGLEHFSIGYIAHRWNDLINEICEKRS